MLKTAVDLFAGLGGSTEGARLAGVRVVAAANHWEAAILAHKANHPDTEHYLQDLHQADFSTWPDFDLLMASPACQGFSQARGTEAWRHDVARSTAWAVISCVEAKQPTALVVENVVEFLKWKLYPQWKLCLEVMGYHLSENVMNAADHGVPQERKRLFVVGVKRDLSRRAVTIPMGEQPRVAIETVLDFDSGSWSAVYKPGRARATINRIENGRRRFGDRFLAPYYGSGSGKTGRSLDRPIGTLTTRDRYCLVDGDRMRMLTVREYLLAQGFPEDYHLHGTRKTDIHLIGNSVAPPVMRSIIEQLKESLN